MAPGSGRIAPPPNQIAAMFDDVVERYDLLNGVLSLGLDTRWRRAAAAAVRPRVGMRVLDLGCGTGDLSSVVVRSGASVTGIDVSHGMLIEGRRKLQGRVGLVRGSAFALPFGDGTFTAAVSGFVLRNLNDLPRAFSELARVLQPGARIGLADITEPRNTVLRKAFDAYFGVVAPALGSLVGKRDAYRYLVRSLAQLPPRREVAAMLGAAGFDEAAARPLTGGIVTLFTGRRASG